jgi:hypothetical protein
MISRDLAAALREAGLIWRPESGDAFVVGTPELEDDVYTISEMTIEAHHHPAGSVLGFNGTTEWALDSVALEDALWLPREDQLRELLRSTFRSLTRTADSHLVEVELAGERRVFDHPEPAEAYGRALLELIRLAA